MSCQQPGLGAAGLGCGHAALPSPSLPPTPRCLHKENYPFLRLNLFRDLVGLHTAAITGNLHFRGNSGSWCLAKPPKSFFCHAKALRTAPLRVLLTEGWIPAGTLKSQLVLLAPTLLGAQPCSCRNSAQSPGLPFPASGFPRLKPITSRSLGCF